MKNRKPINIAVFLIGVVAFSTYLGAAKVPTAEICHYDAEMNQFKLLKINGNAVPAHVSHGDVDPDTNGLDSMCEPQVAIPIVYALAYTDVNGDGQFDDGDVVIAKVFDNVNQGVVGELEVGDYFQVGAYPKESKSTYDINTDFGSYEAGNENTYQDTIHTIAEIFNNNDNDLTVKDSNNNGLSFHKVVGWYEQLYAFQGNSDHTLGIDFFIPNDLLDDPVADFLDFGVGTITWLDPSTPGQPYGETPTSLKNEPPYDDQFLNIELFDERFIGN